MKRYILAIIWLLTLVALILGMVLPLKAGASSASTLLPQIATISYDYSPPVTVTKSTNIYEVSVSGDKILIGDERALDKATKFTPKVVINRWEEASIGLTPQFVASFDASSISFGKISASNTDVSIDFKATEKNQYNDYGGLDMVITLKTPPKSNALSFTYDSQLVTAYLQPALTDTEVREGAIRPDYIVNSIAF